MQNSQRWLDYLARRFVRDNSLSPTRLDEIIVTHIVPREANSETGNFVADAAMVFKKIDGAAYRGAVLFNYNALRLDSLFKNISPEVWLYNPKTTKEVAAELIRRYNVPAEIDWFVDQPINADVLPQIYSIAFKRTNQTVPTTIDVKVNRSEVDLADIFLDNVLDVPAISFVSETNRTNAEFSYAVDFTPDNLYTYHYLRNYPAGLFDEEIDWEAEPVQSLASLIRERMGYPTFYERLEGLQTGDVCFRGSQLVYNGPTAGYVHPDNLASSPGGDTRYDRLLVVRFDSAYSGFQGLGYFHYNDLS